MTDREADRHSLEGLLEVYMKRIDDRLDEKFSQLEEHINKRFNEAFPGGDARGHREFHERDIKSAKTREDIGQDVTKKVTSGIVWAALAAGFLAAWDWLKNGGAK